MTQKNVVIKEIHSTRELKARRLRDCVFFVLPALPARPSRENVRVCPCISWNHDQWRQNKFSYDINTEAVHLRQQLSCTSTAKKRSSFSFPLKKKSVPGVRHMYGKSSTAQLQLLLSSASVDCRPRAPGFRENSSSSVRCSFSLRAEKN